MLGLNDRLKIANEVLTSKVGEEMILLNLQTGMYHSLNPVGTRFIELLNDASRLNDIHEALLEEFEVSTTLLASDLIRLSQEMLSKGLLVKSD
jgi:hypothetical protein